MVSKAVPYVTELRHPLSDLPRCPQCGTAKPSLDLQSIIYKRQAPDSSWEGWAVYQCTSCGDPICFNGNFPMLENLHQQRLWLSNGGYTSGYMMPGLGVEGLDDWPPAARTFMRQALETMAAPDGAVMLAGSAVDAMLKAKGLTGGSVYARINEAVASHMLTEAMGEWAHSVRLAANNPRHADLNSPHASLEQAKATVEFARALGQFLFALPAKIERGREAADEARKDKAGR